MKTLGHLFSRKIDCGAITWSQAETDFAGRSNSGPMCNHVLQTAMPLPRTSANIPDMGLTTKILFALNTSERVGGAICRFCLGSALVFF